MNLFVRSSADGDENDVLVDLDPDASVAELAAALFPRSHADAGCDLGLIVEEVSGGRRVLPPALAVGESGLCSGTTVRPSVGSLPAPHRFPSAVLHVHTGPDAPAQYPLRAGRTTIGRGRDADVRLTDPLVSKHHATVLVGDTVRVDDEASTNGVVMSGRTTSTAVLRAGDRVALGDSTISVTTSGESSRGVGGGGTNHVEFNRSPRLDPTYAGVTLIAPEPPKPPTAARFPRAALVAPLIFASIVFAVTGSLFAILFVGLSPVMMLGTWFESRASNRRRLAAATAHFRTALGELSDQLGYALELERAARRHEHPSVVEVIDAVDSRSALLWTRRPEHDSFGRIRLGLGSQPSRNSVEMPSRNDTLPELWRELVETVARHRDVSEVPIVADLASCGNVGIAGATGAADAVVSGLLVQLVGLHSPADLQLAAFAPCTDWAWLTWLPHTTPTLLADDGAQSDGLTCHLEQTVTERVRRPDRGRTGDSGSGSDRAHPLVVVLVDDDAPIDRSRLVQLAEAGPEVGVHVVWFARTLERLPSVCRTFIEIDRRCGRVGFVRTGANVPDVRCEPAGRAATERLARQLAPLVDSGAPTDAESDLPASVALVDLLGHDVATEPDAIAARWRQAADRVAELSAVVGRTVEGPLRLDLRTQGPHALVGGTTGSGKSEFLQSWIAALAAACSPERVTFLLVDYKGGAAFADCVDLPHCVGLVTDLTPQLVRRALVSLTAEVRRREELLAVAGAKDLVELERRPGADSPPSLVIVVDEFAALVTDVPDFVDGVVNIAQRGRSLGLHLVLATQRPAGVISDNLRANTNLRVALRMADGRDSTDVVGTDQAASFDPDTPGRAVVAAGPGRATVFQAAYSGGRRAGRPARQPITVSPLRFGTTAARPTPACELVASGPTDIGRIVRSIDRAAAGLRPPRRPWLPELAAHYRLEALPPSDGGAAIVFGVADEPDAQAQPVVAFHPDIDGNMAVFGTGGAGKSTWLRAVAVAAGLGSSHLGSTHVYGLDFGSRGLDSLAALPHVGSVVHGDDDERVQRLLRLLATVVRDRAGRFAEARAATITEYRSRTRRPQESRIMLLVDGVGVFRTEYDGGRRAMWWDRFCALASDGRGVGVHVLMAADRPAAIPSALASVTPRRLILRLANEIEYAVADVPTDVLGPRSPPGRGVLDGRVVQIATIGGHGDLRREAEAIERCAEAMRRAGTRPCPPVRSLPTRVALSDLEPVADGLPTIGLDDATLAPVGVPPVGAFLVAGPARSGTTTTIATIVTSIRATAPETDLVLLSGRTSRLASAATWAATAVGVGGVADVATRLAGSLGAAAGRRIVIVVEALGELLNTVADQPLQDLVRASRDVDAFVVVEGETSALSGSWPLSQAIKSYRCGIVLQPEQIDGDTLLKTPFPRIGSAEYPAGRGLMVHSGRVRKVQVALPE